MATRWGALGEGCKPEIYVDERTQKCNKNCARKCARENPEWHWCQTKSIERWYLDLVARRLHCIICFNTLARNCATFRHQMLWCGALFLKSNFSGLQFKAYHQKRHVFCFGQTELI